MNRQIVGALVAAAFMLAITPVLRLLHVADGEEKTRGINIILGLLVVWTANMAPKQFAPLSAITCSPEREQRLRRTAGFLLVGGGLLYSLAWLAAPISLAFPLSVTALGSAVLLTVAQCLFAAQQRNA